ncbi:hypothetical protein OSTOST_20048, partial [Ostertagia ostertagi]
EPLYLHVNDSNKPIVINAERHGFYRQHYEGDGWKKIIDQLKQNHTVYSQRTRDGIISDAFAAALVDKLDYESVFDLLQYSKHEEEYLPWTDIISGFEGVLKYFGNQREAEYA